MEHEPADWLYQKRIAHRGLHNDLYPENSLAAFKNAIEHGYNIETDLYILKDGKIALFHDLHIKRMCGTDAKITDLSSEELKGCKLKNTEETIPLLEDLLNLAEGKTGLLLEFKSMSFSGKLEEVAYEILKNYKGDYAVQSFNPYSVLWFKKHAPTIYRGQLASSYEGNRLQKSLTYALKSLRFRKLNKPDFIAYDIKHIPNRYIETAKEEGKKILAWTVKTPEELERAKENCHNYIFEGFVPEDKA
ncbi:MAG: glycerophosphodiester phosphodiesterase [Clostridiales bacterium]|jgi:glycerophosphoryl diester phosphodiesterase|nr:glycerophosphodiester phosphodiesterase [Clostridiales bacterium]